MIPYTHLNELQQRAKQTNTKLKVEDTTASTWTRLTRSTIHTRPSCRFCNWQEKKKSAARSYFYPRNSSLHAFFFFFSSIISRVILLIVKLLLRLQRDTQQTNTNTVPKLGPKKIKHARHKKWHILHDLTKQILHDLSTHAWTGFNREHSRRMFKTWNWPWTMSNIVWKQRNIISRGGIVNITKYCL